MAILGTRGIPARYGGFETFAEELSTRLVARGHRVVVYTRQPGTPAQYRGVDLVDLPTLRHKYFETMVHTLVSTLHLLFHRVDVALFCNGANAIYTWMPRVAGMPTAINVDGLERKRKKWNALARAWYRLSEWLATFCATEVVSDAKAIAEYYRDRYGAATHFIPYGADVQDIDAADELQRLGLERRGYFLYVSRLEPENNALLVREAFERTGTSLKLALIGDAPYAAEYIAAVRRTSDPRVVMPGAIYGSGYGQLQSHCFAYIHATEVGGTHPALIEAMGRGALVLYLDTVENREVVGGAGIPFEHGNLTDVLNAALNLTAAGQHDLRERARERVKLEYSWDRVTDAYEILFRQMASPH